ncbi:(2Fe-2S)-binding protein (modular protein) [Rhizobium sp. EC-SD404]|nr:(2Fe-2S)-binding protein (modular protein) [Rhizobium sp. EC-SD404]
MVVAERDGIAEWLDMIVCHCNYISQNDIESTIVSLLDEDRWQLIVPAKVYHALSKRGKCCGCFPNVVDTILRVTEEYHTRNTPSAEVLPFMERLNALLDQYGRTRHHEGRRTGHRATEQGAVSRIGGGESVLAPLQASR